MLSRDGTGQCIRIRAQATDFATFSNSARFSAAMHWFQHADPSVKSITVNGSDGDLASTAHYAYCSNSPDVVPLPDPHFFRAGGYAETDKFAATQAQDWGDRSDEIIWRGRVNNPGLYSLDPALQDNPGVKQRLRMAQKCKALGVNFRFVDGVGEVVHGPLASAGLIGEYIPTHDWGGMKYAIDIDGYTNAWCNFLQRLKLGCCVLKVDSQFGFRQWYYHKLTAWEHYVPISADMSDLAANVDWVKSNPDKARAIAAAGQDVARAMTFETETRVAADIINTTEGAI
ncbi:glycosyl transferase family 90 [Yoonia sp. I 8.24]|uniref:glycosyl transferase family 90 n=1 Tax=Yoonia sp. I 8.24 TaxID=1537229 RepID=UPI001EDE8FE3|nr:glycosyl transferase family 90 [Yoonia sp. I 8.24]MCG3268469.1 lipopolysaccharide-modifying protein [Yoonia sp. I 8.24]